MTNTRTICAPRLDERIEYYEQFKNNDIHDVCRLVARDLVDGAGR